MGKSLLWRMENRKTYHYLWLTYWFSQQVHLLFHQWVLIIHCLSDLKMRPVAYPAPLPVPIRSIFLQNTAMITRHSSTSLFLHLLELLVLGRYKCVMSYDWCHSKLISCFFIKVNGLDSWSCNFTLMIVIVSCTTFLCMHMHKFIHREAPNPLGWYGCACPYRTLQGDIRRSADANTASVSRINLGRIAAGCWSPGILPVRQRFWQGLNFQRAHYWRQWVGF